MGWVIVHKLSLCGFSCRICHLRNSAGNSVCCSDKPCGYLCCWGTLWELMLLQNAWPLPQPQRKWYLRGRTAGLSWVAVFSPKRTFFYCVSSFCQSVWAKNSRRESANAALREWHVFSSVCQDLLKYDRGTQRINTGEKSACSGAPRVCIIICIATGNANALYKHRVRDQCSL